MTRQLPWLVTICAGVALIAYGPIAQFADYHRFADQRTFAGIPHAADVWSNAGFAVVALWGLGHVRRARSWGFALLALSLLLTAIGSAFYHLAPDDARMVWDRMPIALACAGLLAWARAQSSAFSDDRLDTVVFAAAAIGSVIWWKQSGDLRPYLLIQALPLVLIPLWQARARASRASRIAVSVAIALYAIAKLTELNDHTIYAMTGVMSGHTIKHLLATAASAVVVAAMIPRSEAQTYAEPDQSFIDSVPAAVGRRRDR